MSATALHPGSASGHPRKTRSIRTRLLVWFGLTFALAIVLVKLVDVVGIPGTRFIGEFEWQRQQTFDHLQAMGDLIEGRLLRMTTERKNDVIVAASSRLVGLHVAELRNRWSEALSQGLRNEALRQHLRNQPSYQLLLDLLARYQSTFRIYREILIIDSATGTILVATDETHSGTVSADERENAAASRTAGFAIADVGICPRTGFPSLHMGHPISPAAGEVLTTRTGESETFLIMELDPDDLIAPILEARSLLGNTGEALMVNNRREIVTSLKHPLADGRAPRPLQFTNQGTPARLAATGRRGVTETTDYRGVSVLASYRHIQVAPDWGWGLVVKQDRAEAFAPAYRSLAAAAGVTTVAVMIVLSLTAYLSRHLTKPITALGKAAERISSGDLSARSPIESTDEVSLLAHTFNEMVSRIQQWHNQLEEQILVRTTDLNRVNTELRMEMADRQKAETGIRLSEARFRTLFSGMAEGVALHRLVRGPDGAAQNYIITDINAQYEAIVGLKQANVVGRLATEVYGTPQPPYLDEFAGVVASGQSHRFETYFAPMQKHFHICVASMGDDQFATIFFDITERKQAEAELTELTRTLTSKNKELQSIVYVASHDLRSPLVNIQGFSRELSRSCKSIQELVKPETMPPETARQVTEILSDDIPKSVGFILAGAAKMDGLLRGLLSLSRLGRAGLKIERLDMNAMFAAIAKAIEFQLQQADARLEVEALPPCRGDATQISQVFTNLIDNSLKYRDKNRNIVIRVTGQLDDDKVVYRVEDNGIGIAPQHQEKIFEIFHRLDLSVSSGEGLGLTIARRVLDRHNGNIRVESQPGQGSTFFVSLPGDK